MLDKGKYILLGLTYENEKHSILTDFEGEDILKVFGMERDEFYSFLKTLNGMPLKRIWRNEKK